MRKLTFLLACLILTSLGLVQAQSKIASGRVLYAENGEPIIGASVLVKGTRASVTTDVKGDFLINLPGNARTLVVSFIGMKSIEVEASTKMVIKLESTASELDEVIVVAYGTTNRKSFTGSAQSVRGDELEKRTVTSITKALDGQIAGIQTTTGNGQPGSGSSIIIRGLGSINASSNPLYVVDGIPFNGSLNTINPNDIESISVLKDASAGALYGARGGNGVVVITTKHSKEKSDKVRVNFKSTFGVSSRAIPAYSTLNQKEYLETAFQAYKNQKIDNGVSPAEAGSAALEAMAGTTTGMLGLNEQYNPYNYALADLINPTTGKVRDDAKLVYDQNWQDEILAKNPLRQEYQLSFAGGSTKTQYNTSFSYLDEKGLLKTTSFNRFTGRVNIESQVNDWLRFGSNLNYAQTKSNYGTDDTESSISNVWYSVQFMAPIYPIYNLDDNHQIIKDATGANSYDYGKSRPSGAQSNFNSIATLYNDAYYSNVDNVNARGFLEIAPIKDLKFRTNIGVDNSNTYSTTYYNPDFGNAVATSGLLNKDNSRMLSYTFNQLVTYNKKISSHAVEVLLGHEYYSYKYNYLMAEKTGFPFARLYELTAGSSISNANSYQTDYHIDSYFSRLNYNYDEKYYLAASLRSDKSSRFYKDNNQGIFWSLGASWRLSQEAFMADMAWANNITVKASFGEQGNDALGSFYAWQALYNLGYPNANTNGAMVSSIENKNVSWEKNQNTNIGVDFKLVDRLNGSIEYFNRKTVDMLLYKPMATSLGFDGVNTNIGSMQNNGIEITLGYDVVKTQDLKWTMTLIGQTLNNKVLKLVNGADINSGNTIIREGEPLYSFNIPHSAGVDPATGNRLFWFFKKDTKGKKIEGTDYISDDYKTASNYRQLSGSRYPSFQGSINNSVSYKGFDLSLLMTYSIGGKVLDSNYASFMNPMYIGDNYSTNVLRAWKEAGDLTDVPRVVLGSTSITTDAFLVNASYFNIRSINLGYTVDKSFTKKFNLESLRFFASAENVFLFSCLKGMDPQLNFTGTNSYSYTPNRLVSMGLDINF